MGFPSFASGDVLLAADMNAVGLWLVKTQTIGTTVSTQAVTDAFSASYDHYLITVGGGTASTGGNIKMTFSGAGATDYYEGRPGINLSTGAFVGNVTNGGSEFIVGQYSTTGKQMYTVLMNPFNTTLTRHISPGYLIGTTETAASTGVLNNSTSYTGFTLTASSGTWTGGTIRVYGYRN